MLLYKKIDTIFVRSRFSNRAHYNEFVENGSKSWALMRRRLVLGVKNTQNQKGNVPGRKDLSPEDRNSQLLSHPKSLSPFSGPSSSFPPCFGWSLLLYIPLFHSFSSYTYQSFMSILECTSHWPLFLALCELLWPPLHYPGVTSTSMGSEC